MGDMRYLTPKFPSWILKLSKRNLKQSSTSWILPLKLTFLWGSFFKVLRLVNIDAFKPIKTIFFFGNIPLTEYESSFDKNPRKSGKIRYCGAMYPRTSKHKPAIRVDY